MCQAGASIDSWRFRPPYTWASQKHSCHWSCWSPPGVPKASVGTPSRRARDGDSVIRGRLRGAREFGRPCSSQNIWPRESRQKPSDGIVGLDCSQPPDGVSDTRLPAASTTSRCTVSPRVWPWGPTVGSPVAPPSACTPCSESRIAGSRAGPRASPGRSDGRRRVGDQGTPGIRVRSRKQHVQRHVGVAVPRLAVREGQLRRFDRQVHRALRRHSVHKGQLVAEAVHQQRLLQQRRALRPAAHLDQAPVVDVDEGRVFVRRRPRRQVVAGEQARVVAAGVVAERGPAELVDRFGDKTL